MSNKINGTNSAQGMASLRKTATAIALATASALMPSLQAQELEEIVVTVERRSQSLQDFAGTAQVFDSGELDKSYKFQKTKALKKSIFVALARNQMVALMTVLPPCILTAFTCRVHAASAQ